MPWKGPLNLLLAFLLGQGPIKNFSAGYNDAHTSPTQDDFEYDSYGNLILDRDKGITTVEYNHLNLPNKILFRAGGKIEYFYDAVGIKLKKKVTDGMSTTTTEYHNGFQYNNGVLDFFPHAEGYVKAVPTGGGAPGGPSILVYKYVFNFTDHLGNIRLKYAQDPSNGNAVSILEEDHYYPYGLKHRGYSSSHLVFGKEDDPGTGIVLTPVNPFLGDSYKYKFGGKEYQDEFDINTYDFGARNYDPALGRWMNIDPLAELSRRYSPYAYALDNPVYFIDPDGRFALASGTGLGISDISTDDLGGGNGSGESDDGGNESSSSGSGSSEPPTKFVDEGGTTIADTDDGNDQTFVITKDNEDEFVEELCENIESKDDLSAAKNKELGNKYGYDIKDIEENAAREYPTMSGEMGDFGFVSGYQIGYGSDKAQPGMDFMMGKDDKNFSGGSTTGYKVGGRHLSQGKMNMFNPQLKNNPARIQTNQRVRTIQTRNYTMNVGGLPVNTVLPNN